MDLPCRNTNGDSSTMLTELVEVLVEYRPSITLCRGFHLRTRFR